MAEKYVRTQVRTTNPAKGVYRTLNGCFEIRAAERKGHWDVFRLVGGGAERIAGEVRGYDRALDSLLALDGVTLEALNTRPAKAKPEPQPEATATEAKPKRQRKAPVTA